MTYTALYRRFRPANFRDMVGQAHIGKTLAYAVDKGSFVHAYLLCGPRGTGKTSTAKVLAKAVNCLNPDKGEPCGQCRACVRIADGESLDILEIDAASNRGIDEIRDLRERVKYAPAQEKLKVYIIDEVHMLTGEAFNALLKTLEEPPGHVVFILATTEPHKIPLTVLSRCQRFDFRRIGVEDMQAHLAGIAQIEGIGINPEALALIARKAEGSMRDAVNLLDQCSAFGEEEIDASIVAAVLGCVDSAFIEAMAEDLLQGCLSGVLEGMEELSSSGKDFRQFLYDLLDYLRSLLLSALDNRASDLPPWGQDLEPGRILQAIQALSEADSRLRHSLQPRITLELALIQACGEIIPAPSARAGQRRPRPKAGEGAKALSIPKEGAQKAPQEEEKPTPISRTAVKAPVPEEPEEERPPLPSPPPEPSGAEKPRQEKEQEEGAAGEEFSLELVQARWPELLKAVSKGDQHATFTFLQWGKPLSLEGNKLILGFYPDFEVHMQTLCQKPAHKNWVEEKLRGLFGRPLQISGRLLEDNPEPSGENEQISLF